jgi:hypothetical protein
MVGRMADAASALALPAGDDFPDKLDHVEPGDVDHRSATPSWDQIAPHNDLDLTEGTQFFGMLL